MELPRVIATEVLEEDVVPVNAPVVIAANGVEHGEVFDGGALATRLLPDLPDEGLLDGLTDLYDTSWDAPFTLRWLPASLDK